MAEGAKKTNIMDIVLPAFAFLASASGPYGAAGTQSLLSAMGLSQRRKGDERKEERLNRILNLEEDAARYRREKEKPLRELEAEQLGFQTQALRDIGSEVNQPTPSSDALAALGVDTTSRLQEALGRGEQVPLPQEQPGPSVRRERLDRIASTPGGAAQLEAAGLGRVATSRRKALGPETDPREFAKDKRGALGILRQFSATQIDDKTAQEVKKQILGASSQNDLTAAIAAIPQAAGAEKNSIEEQVYTQLTRESGMSGIEALAAMSQAKRQPESPDEQALRRARIAKLNSETKKLSREASGAMKPAEQRKLRLEVRGDIRQEPVYKDYQNALGGYTAVSVGSKRGDAQGDLAILNGIVRLLDPGSVVRPSEFEAAKRAQGLIEQLEVIIPRIQQGEILNPDTRQRYLTLAQELLQEYGDASKNEVGQVYGGIMQDAGMTLDDVFVSPRPLPAAQPAARPPAGGAAKGGSTPAAPAFTIKGIREKP